jgi:hypothetical protein
VLLAWCGRWRFPCAGPKEGVLCKGRLSGLEEKKRKEEERLTDRLDKRAKARAFLE